MSQLEITSCGEQIDISVFEDLSITIPDDFNDQSITVSVCEDDLVVSFFIFPFYPQSLFSAGEQGVWYDPSDFSTMFQSSTGTTPVTAVEQPVGLILDKSKGLALGPELVTNGTFDANVTGWTASRGSTVTWQSGTLRVTNGVTQTSGTVDQAITTEANAWYVLTATMTATNGTNGRVRAATAVGLTGTLLAGNDSVSSGQTVTLYFAATGTTTYVTLGVFSGTVSVTYCEFDNVTVKKISGNHASQSTSASRPVLSARVNELLATATLATQNVTTRAATYTLAFSGTGTVTTSGTNVGVYSAGSNSLVCTAGTLTLTVSGSVTSADLRVTNTGVGLPAYQAVVTSTNYNTTGFPLYLRFDGTDDSMATATITPGVDKAQVFAGVRKQIDAAINTFVELGTNSATVAGTLGMFSATNGYRFRSIGTIAVDPNTGAYPPPNTNILTGLGDISGDLATLRVNTTQVAQSTADQGTGNYLAYPLYIGSRAGSLLRFNGNIYSLIVRFGANLDASTISNTETWVNGKTKAF